MDNEQKYIFGLKSTLVTLTSSLYTVFIICGIKQECRLKFLGIDLDISKPWLFSYRVKYFHSECFSAGSDCWAC